MPLRGHLLLFEVVSQHAIDCYWPKEGNGTDRCPLNTSHVARACSKMANYRTYHSRDRAVAPDPLLNEQMQTLISCANSHTFVGADLCVVDASNDDSGRVSGDPADQARVQGEELFNGSHRMLLEEGKVASNCGYLDMERTLTHVALLVRGASARNTGQSDRYLF
jgi:hypothetical protein